MTNFVTDLLSHNLVITPKMVHAVCVKVLKPIV
jgi:hypothetical protein